MLLRELLPRVEKITDLDDWAKERYEKTGNVRWQSIFYFYSIDFIKAGFLIKKSGVWYITPEGETALKNGPQDLLNKASLAYRKWAQERPTKVEKKIEADPEPEPLEQAFEEDIEQKAQAGLEQYINSKNAYEFQDLVAALLRGMKYYTPFVAPKGKDGGVDIVAYRDPLGTESPRIQVQVKHREASATVQEVRQLMGLLQKEGDVGVFVSTGGFTSDGRSAARGSHVHIELIDLPRFIALWQEFYDKLSEEDKNLLPLRPVYFLADIE